MTQMFMKPDRLKLDYITILDQMASSDNWQPDDPWHVDLAIELGISWDSDREFEIFYSRVQTYAMRERARERRGSMILMQTFDSATLQDNILDLLAKAERRTWDESLLELRKLFKWQYEDCNWG